MDISKTVGTKVMKKLLTMGLLIAVAQAAEVGPLTSFSAGTPAKAAEVNGNFDAVKNAVNENYQRLTAAETAMATKQTQISESCAVGSAIVAISTEGKLTCAPLVKAGVISVPAVAFNTAENQHADCNYHRGARGYFTGAGTTPCLAMAPVNLPDGVTVTGLACSVFDNGNVMGAQFGLAYLRRVAASNFVLDAPFEAPGTLTNSPSPQIMSATDNSMVVSNAEYGYFIGLQFDQGSHTFDEILTGLSLIACRVTYTP